MQESLDANGCGMFDIDNVNLFSLLYADDTVLFSNSEKGLQLLINKLQIYCEKWQIEVNVEKTKAMVFHTGNRMVKSAVYYNGVLVQIVKNFVYLGVNFFINGK